MSAAAGWYPDPTGAPGGRWWDGAQWTAHTLAPPVAPRPVDVPPRPRRLGGPVITRAMSNPAACRIASGFEVYR